MGVVDLEQAKMEFVEAIYEEFFDWLAHTQGYEFCGSCEQWFESDKDMKDGCTCKMCYALSIHEPEV